MNKRELLEACAKATGRPIDFPISEDSPASRWNPLESDGDCARMEAEIGVDVVWSDDAVLCSLDHRNGGSVERYVNHTSPQAARRRASCRAVAATVERA